MEISLGAKNKLHLKESATSESVIPRSLRSAEMRATEAPMMSRGRLTNWTICTRSSLRMLETANGTEARAVGRFAWRVSKARSAGANASAGRERASDAAAASATWKLPLPPTCAASCCVSIESRQSSARAASAWSSSTFKIGCPKGTESSASESRASARDESSTLDALLWFFTGGFDSVYE